MIEQEFAYPNAPITEAVIDFRVAARDGLTVKDMLPITERLKPEYPDIAERHQATAALDVAQRQSHIEIVPIGYAAHATNKDWIYQVQVGGLSVSRLRPYTCWSDLRNEARRIWGIYCDVLQPTAINRVGLRYINKIDIPDSKIELDKFFRTWVKVSADIAGKVHGFYFQVQITQEDIECLCVINCTILPPPPPPPPPDIVSILLDIDLFTAKPINFSANQAWELLESMRLRKNTLFEACITDRTRELFR
jgi:uncharacterized protein (TIGR04255 family)